MAPNETASKSETQAYLYDADGRDREVTLESVAVEKLGPDDLLWIDLPTRDRSRLEEVSALLALDNGVWNARESARSLLENYRDYFRFTVNSAPHPDGNRREPEESAQTATPKHFLPGTVALDFVVSERWLVTVHEGDVPCLNRFRDQDKADTLIGLLSGQALAASLLDWHLGEYFHEVSRIEEAVDRLDERVLRESASRSLLGRMVALRRRVSNLRSLLVAQREVFYGLSRPDFALVTESGATPFYESLVGRFERAVDEVERTRDVVVGSFELFTSRTGQQTNDLVKVLTFLTAIVGFCAAIAGLMGMNFKLAFFDTGLTGFAMVTGGLVSVALISVVYARYRDWI
ncbi:MAG TPA: CorA family divalent cation transporter [Gemmatimonadaceae bacterium]|nr:CorA family divalent cation transporter [Gemmatimonadaceae bacterium]